MSLQAQLDGYDRDIRDLRRELTETHDANAALARRVADLEANVEKLNASAAHQPTATRSTAASTTAARTAPKVTPTK